MLRSLISFMERRGCTRMISRLGPDGKIEWYLKRYYIIRSKWFGLFLHQFWSSDPDHYHDHPWPNFGLVLRGGYHETGPDGITKWRPVGFFRFRQAEVFHRISIGPHTRGAAWTLFGHFKRIRKWGFWTPDGWLEAKEYGEQHGSPVEIEGIDFEIVGHLFPKVRELKSNA